MKIVPIRDETIMDYRRYPLPPPYFSEVEPAASDCDSTGIPGILRTTTKTTSTPTGCNRVNEQQQEQNHHQQQQKTEERQE